MNRRTIAIGAGVVVVSLIGLGIGAVVLLPSILEDDVRALIDTQLDSALDADASFGTLEVTLLSTFPRLEARVTDIQITGHEPFADVQLLSLPEARIGLNVWSLLGSGPIDIRTVTLTSPRLHLATLPDGRSNLDAFTGGEGESTPWQVRLASLDITDAGLIYDDDEAGIDLRVDDLDLSASGNLSSTTNALTTEASIATLSLQQGGITWLRDTRWSLAADVEHDLSTSALTVKSSTTSVNALTVALAGSVAPDGDGWALDLTLSTPDTAFKPLLSLVPGAYTSSFDGVDADGTVTLAGTVKGTYVGESWPAFDLALGVRGGRFRYPDLPVGVEGIGVDVGLRHPGGDPDKLEIDVDRLAMSVGGTPVEARLRLRQPMSDPDLEASAKGRIDLDQLGRAIPAVADAEPPSGVLDLDVTASGRMSAFQAQQADKVRAEGTVKGIGLRYQPEDWPVVRIDVLDVALSPARAELRSLNLSWARLDLSATGAFDNLLPWLVADETLTGAVTVRSNKGLDLRPFQGDEDGDDAPDSADDAVVIAIPANLDITVDARFPQVRTTELDMTDVSGTAVVRDQTLTLDRWKATMLGGEATLSGSYRAETDQHADIDMSVDGLRFDVARAATRFETLTKMLPVLEGATGRFDTDVKVNLRILRDGTPELSLLSSQGLIGSTGVKVSPPTIQDLAQQLGRGDAASLSPGRIRYAVDKGMLTFEPFDAKVGALPAQVSGSVGVIAGTLDLAMDLDVPTKGLTSAPFLSSLAGSVPSTAKVRATITGTYDKPKLGLTLAGAGDLVEGIKDQVVEQAKVVANEAIDDLVAAARLQGDALVAAAEKEAATLRAEGKKAADKLRSQASKEGDKLVDAAKGNPLKLAAAKEGAKALDKEAEKAAGKVEREADKAADAVVAEARKARDTLISEAEAKMRSAVR